MTTIKLYEATGRRVARMRRASAVNHVDKQQTAVNCNVNNKQSLYIYDTCYRDKQLVLAATSHHV